MTIDLPVSSIFDDRYEIIEQIGEGGMGRVYKVKEIELNRLVALIHLLFKTAEGSRFDETEAVRSCQEPCSKS